MGNNPYRAKWMAWVGLESTYGIPPSFSTGEAIDVYDVSIGEEGEIYKFIDPTKVASFHDAKKLTRKGTISFRTPLRGDPTSPTPAFHLFQAAGFNYTTDGSTYTQVDMTTHADSSVAVQLASGTGIGGNDHFIFRLVGAVASRLTLELELGKVAELSVDLVGNIDQKALSTLTDQWHFNDSAVLPVRSLTVGTTNWKKATFEISASELYEQPDPTDSYGQGRKLIVTKEARLTLDPELGAIALPEVEDVFSDTITVMVDTAQWTISFSGVIDENVGVEVSDGVLVAPITVNLTSLSIKIEEV